MTNWDKSIKASTEVQGIQIEINGKSLTLANLMPWTARQAREIGQALIEAADMMDSAHVAVSAPPVGVELLGPGEPTSSESYYVRDREGGAWKYVLEYDRWSYRNKYNEQFSGYVTWKDGPAHYLPVTVVSQVDACTVAEEC